jgi:hypothetical protein
LPFSRPRGGGEPASQPKPSLSLKEFAQGSVAAPGKLAPADEANDGLAEAGEGATPIEIAAVRAGGIAGRLNLLTGVGRA